MTFTTSQLRQLRAPIRPEVVKQREVEGKVLHYLEGWHIVSEANRIFGYDGWDRETLQSQCVWQKQIDYRYAAAYLIPNPIDQYPCAHSRSPMDMMRQG